MRSQKLFSNAAEKNKEPIGKVLEEYLHGTGSLLEIASGSGQHAVFYAAQFPSWQWHPSDKDSERLASIELYRKGAGLRNLHAPVELDVEKLPWPEFEYNCLLAINLLHISPPATMKALFEGAATVLPREGLILLYGPFRTALHPTAPSNEQFDLYLKSLSSEYGLRTLEELSSIANDCSFEFVRQIAMPANNFMVIFKKL